MIDSSMKAPPTRYLGEGDRFELQSCLGEGGNGSVWKAIDRKHHKEVAIKLPNVEALNRDDFAKYFENEIKSAMHFANDCPSIVRVFDAEIDSAQPYIVMQYLKNGSLEDYRERSLQEKNDEFFDSAKCLSWLDPVARAVDFLNDEGVIHRDIKPANILFDRNDNPYLADFGIAKVLSDELNKVKMHRGMSQNMLLGTLGYLAPDYTPENPDPSTDQYALACTVFKFLSGKRPFMGSQHQVLKAQSNAVPNICSLRPNLPVAVGNALQRAMSPIASERFGGNSEFSEAIRNGFVSISGPVPSPALDVPPHPQSGDDPTSKLDTERRDAEEETIVQPKSPSKPAPKIDPIDTAIGSKTFDFSRYDGLKKRSTRNRMNWRDRVCECPWCWKKFDPEEMLWIAEHSELHGDTKLPEEFVRFLPDKFNARGNAIDLYGRECKRLACPKCHLEYPRELLDFEPLVVSLLGIPSSGKTCFTAAMMHQLRSSLTEHFKFRFDSNPLFNQQLDKNEGLLFDAGHSRRLVRLPKTEPNDPSFGYRQIVENGQTFSYLKPQVFSLSPMARHPNAKHAEQISFGFCIYDNSGEDFQISNQSDESPVTKHLNVSDAIWFVFDPTQQSGFREYCRGKSRDPQFKVQGALDVGGRQENVVSTAAHSLRTDGVLKPGKQYENPIIVILNKYDAWGPAFGGKRYSEPWKSSSNHELALFDVDQVLRVSETMRRLLLKLSPDIVSTTESMGSHVVYVPVSSFGRPVMRDKEGNNGVPANNLKPMWTEVPFLYLLSQCYKGIIRSTTIS